MKRKSRGLNLNVDSSEIVLSRAELDELQRDLKRRGVRQKLDVDRPCVTCGKRPTVICNTWSGDFVDGRECQTPVCIEC